MAVYITDTNLSDVDVEKGVLEAAGLKLNGVGHCRTERDVVECCGGSETVGLMVQFARVGEQALASMPNLKVISRYGVGVDTIDLEACSKRGVAVCNVPAYCDGEVSTHAFALLLDLIRHLSPLELNTKHGGWNCKIGGAIHRMEGRTIGVVGFGSIGRKMAKKSLGFDLQVVVYDPFVDAAAVREAGGTKADTLEQLLQASDYISLHCPLTAGTRHMINKETLAHLKPGAVLVNTSRGGLIDELALVEALQKGILAGAALDVLEQEPPDASNPLLSMDNVILTPHAAFYSEEAMQELRTITADNVVKVITGAPQNVVNKLS